MSSNPLGIDSSSYRDSAVASDSASTQQHRRPNGVPVPPVACRYIGPPIGMHLRCDGSRARLYSCRHPQHGETTVEACATCGDRLPPAQSELAERIPEPPNPHEKVRKWSVGVTTAPRRETTLETCLERLVTAGWDEWTVFAEPESEIPHRYRTKTCWRKRRLHAWPNFYLGLAELFMVEPDADAYFMLQDDALLCKDRVREYLESVMWPEHPSRIGFISLYTSAAYARAQAGWYRQEGEPWRWGALALLFPASSVRSLLSSPLVINHRLSPAGTKCIDRVLGDWAWHMRLNNWITTPSLVRHSGDTSTIRGHSVNDGFRQASIAVEP